MSSDKNRSGGEILAAPLSIQGVGADGVLPPEASTVGATLLIPMWADPSDQESDLLEIWVLEPGASDEILFYSNLFPVPIAPPPPITLPAQYLQLDGEIRLRYRVTAGDTGNPDTSAPQVFIVNRAPPVNLEKPTFPNATLWGYLNCNTEPKLWERVLVRVPAQPGRFAINDNCTLDWEGFYSLNAVGPIVGTALRLTKLLTQEEASSTQGFDFVLESDKYEQHIKPMEKDASALASYTLYRNGIAQGKSPPGLVKIDRVIPGEILPCGPNSVTGVNSNAESTLAFSNSLTESTIMNVQVKSGGDVLAVPPVVVDQLSDNRLTYKQLREDRKIKVRLTSIDDTSVEGGAKVELYLFPEGASVVEGDPTYLVGRKYKADQPGGVWAFPVEFDVDVGNLNDAFDSAGEYRAYELAFIIFDANDNSDTSTNQPVLVDLTAPYQRQPGTGNGTGTRPSLLTLGTTVPDAVDDAWLNDPANAGGLNLTIPIAYQKFEANNDKINFYISTQTAFSLMQAETPAFSGPLPGTGVINVPLAFLRALDEGTYYYSYNLTDLPGNISNSANITLLFQRIRAPAPVLHDPSIPVTNGGALPINFSTVVEPPTTRAIMEIEFPDNSLPGDRIIPYLYSTEDGPYALPEQQIPPAGTPGPLKFELDYTTLEIYFGSPNKEDETELEYWYEMERSTITPNPVSTHHFAVIDFSYAGPEQPNLPDPENPNIVAVEVQGAGATLPPVNTLGPDQAGLAATMQWPVWTDPARPVTGREIVKFYYQGKQVGSPIPVRIGNTTVTTELLWATILAEGNGTVAGGDAREAYITIEYPGGNLMQQQITTKVDVTAIVIDLPAPQVIKSAYRTSTGALVAEEIRTSINCPSLNHPEVVDGPMPPYQPRNLRIRIPRDPNIPTGATVDLEFEGRETNAANAAPIPNTKITASAQMPATGDLEFRLTDYDKIREIQLPSTVPGTRPATRYARIAYTVNGIESEVTLGVALLNSSLVYCEEERPETP